MVKKNHVFQFQEQDFFMFRGALQLKNCMWIKIIKIVHTYMQTYVYAINQVALKFLLLSHLTVGINSQQEQLPRIVTI